MWYNNDLDNHHITHNRKWFLRENRFLFFTRNGPVEITLKPTTVLASAIICMVGVSVIFLSTIFASYSAIEVIRDESIQRAEASISTAVDDSQTKNLASDQGDNDDAITWQGNIAARIAKSDTSSMISGKTATAPKPLPSRFNTKPQVNAPSPAELPSNNTLEHLENSQEIVNADHKQDPHQSSAPPKNSKIKDDVDKKDDNITEADAPGSNSQFDPPIMNLALASPNAANSRTDL